MSDFKYLITGALPYVNFDLHFGHVVACLLRPDIYKRFLKQKNEDVIAICGSDEYGTPSLVAAEKEKLAPQALCDKYHKIQKEAIEKLNIRFDIFSRTTTPEHVKMVQDFYYKLKQNNCIYRKEIEQLYCEKCSRALPDRYVRGTCPHCGSENARGDQCEKCGKTLEPTQLKDPYCETCKSKPALKKTEHVFFELSKLNEPLLEWMEKNKHWPDNARKFALNWLKEGLQDKDISRDLPWGVPIPDAKGLVFYVWFDAPLGYITFSKQIAKESWWKEKNTRIIHFIGKDNIAFHAISFPGMLYAHGDYQLPYQVSSCEFLNYEGGKFSKSGKHGIFLNDAVKLYPADYWRYYLTTVIPETHDTYFEWKDFQDKINCDLNDVVGNFVHRTLTLAEKHYGEKIGKPALSEKDEEILGVISKTVESASKLMYNIELKKALQEIINLARSGNQFITAEEPWKNEARRQNVIYDSLCIAKALSVLLEPFIPETAGKLRKYLNIKDTNWDSAKQFPEEFEISAFEPLFKKIEDDEIEKHRQAFGGNAAKKEQVKEVETVKYEDFEKMDLRIAKIISAEKIEKADKLLKLTIKIGEEERTIVAGMATYYKPEELINKKIVVLANLEPRKIRGIESRGMLLAAENEEGKVALLTVEKDMTEGAKIR